ncbi:MAG TPA: hypothetical protein VLA99_02165 [Nitrospiraceae bacterium]|nr:hypothetical protein [Nitrospiraceae bacterium]
MRRLPILERVAAMNGIADATRALIMGAAGRDSHNFNVVFWDDPQYRVVAFTAAQIPNIAGRRYRSWQGHSIRPVFQSCRRKSWNR